uniref:AGC-kinase C-terminal domain-containing protein n=1 Tax=Timema douglasi TaxID=61478 RepID=A0A7R8VW25_TIMDO|nr:unnamed protein product [Timema douglasi]
MLGTTDLYSDLKLLVISSLVYCDSSALDHAVTEPERWFQGFDWDGLKQRTLSGPIVQQIRGPTDTANFDTYPKDIDIPPDELSNWDIDF